MRHFLSKPAVGLGAVLLLLGTCAGVHAQGSPPTAGAPAPVIVQQATSAMPATYTPPAYPPAQRFEEVRTSFSEPSSLADPHAPASSFYAAPRQQRRVSAAPQQTRSRPAGTQPALQPAARPQMQPRPVQPQSTPPQSTPAQSPQPQPARFAQTPAVPQQQLAQQRRANPPATQPVPGHDPLKLKQRFGNSMLFNKPLQQLLPQRVPPTTIVLQQVQPIPLQAAPAADEQAGLPQAPPPPTLAAGGPSSRRAAAPAVMPSAQTPPSPLPAAPQGTQIAQIPGGLPQGAVVVFMPQGWQPQGVAPQFAPREVSREVPSDFWPAPKRNPFGNADRGVFSWSEILNWDDENDASRPKGSSRALFAVSKPESKTSSQPGAGNSSSRALFASSSSTQKEAPSASQVKSGSRALLSVLTASNSNTSGKQKSKALFTIRPADELAQMQANGGQATTGETRDEEPTAAAPQLVEAPRPPQPPTVQETTSREAATSTRPTTSRLKNRTASESKPAPRSEARHTKWRAKGAPREMSLAEESEATPAETQVVAHTEPAETRQTAEPVPASSAASRATTADRPTPASRQPTPARQPAPSSPNGASSSSSEEPTGTKALLSRELLSGKTQRTTTADETAQQETPTPAKGRPLDEEEQEDVQLVAAVEPVPQSTGRQKALLPSLKPGKMAAELFAGRSDAAETRTARHTANAEPAPTPVDDVSSRSTQSYYAPSAQPQPAASTSGNRASAPARPQYADPRQQSLAHPDAMRGTRGVGFRPYTVPQMREQTQHSAPPPAPEQEPVRPARRILAPLAKPLSALGELTKLPSFMTDAIQRDKTPLTTPTYDDPQAAQVARRRSAQAAVAASSPPSYQPPQVSEPDAYYADVAAGPTDGPSSRRRQQDAPAPSTPARTHQRHSGTRITQTAVPTRAQVQQADSQPSFSTPSGSPPPPVLGNTAPNPAPARAEDWQEPQLGVDISAPSHAEQPQPARATQPTAATLLAEPEGDGAVVRDETPSEPAFHLPEPMKIEKPNGKTVKVYSGAALRQAAEQRQAALQQSSGRRQVAHQGPAAEASQP